MDSSSLLRPAVIVPIVAVAVIVLGAIIGFATLARGKRRAAALRRWTHGAYSLWTGGEDCGTWAKDRATASLASWYGATGPGHLWKVIAELRDGQTGNPAWDQVRALAESLGLRSRLFDIRATPQGFAFVGSGFGHGVGMSQWGARELARRGASYQRILARFYPGARLEAWPSERVASRAENGERRGPAELGGR